MSSTHQASLGTIGNARSEAQVVAYQGSIGQGTCPFCVINRKNNPFDLDTELPISPGNSWFAWENAWPYPGHATHIVAPSREHWVSLNDITDKGITDLLVLMKALQREHRMIMPGGIFVMRFGDHRYNAGSLAHLHAQLQFPSRLSPSFVTLGNPTADQREEIIEILLTASPHLGKDKLLQKHDHWDLCEVTELRLHMQQHFLMEYHAAGTRLDIISAHEWLELWNIIRHVVREKNLPGGSVLLRYGDPGYSGRPSNKLFAEIIVADGTGPLIEVLCPAKNRDQAEKSLGGFSAFRPKKA